MPRLHGQALAADALLALRIVHDACYSPDGQHIAIILSRADPARDADRFELLLLDPAHGKTTAIPFAGDALHPRWSRGGRLAFLGRTEDSSRFYVVDERGTPVAVTPADAVIQGPPGWTADGSTIAGTTVTKMGRAGIRRIDQRIFRAEGIGEIDGLVHRVGLASADGHGWRLAATGDGAPMQPAISPDGTRLLFLAARGAAAYPTVDAGARLCLLDLASGKIDTLLDEQWFVAGARWSPCGTRVVAAAASDSELSVPVMDLWSVPLNGGAPVLRTGPITGHIGLKVHHDMPSWGTSQTRLFAVPDAAMAFATVTRAGRAEIWQIALDGEPYCEPVITGERSCVLLDVDPANDRLLFAATDLNMPWALFEAALDGSAEQQLTRFNESIMANWARLAITPLQVESADGLMLDAWHVAHPGTPLPAPTILFLHGGPYLSTGHAFRFDFHLLAARGFGVVFANFRGSAGYGRDFTARIMGDWGGNGLPDHLATIDTAIARGLADPDRLGVWGASHGGFATCWTVTHCDRFRAAVAEAAITSFETIYYLSDATGWVVRELGGRPDEIPDIYRARSPLSHAQRCRTPTLMLHGEADLRCPPSEAEQFYRALCDADCPAELFLIAGMNHMGDSDGPLSVRVAQNEALVDWFERYLGDAR